MKETEFRDECLQAKEPQGLPEPPEARREAVEQPPRRNQPWALDSEPLNSEKKISLVLSHPSLWYSDRAALGYQ